MDSHYSKYLKYKKKYLQSKYELNGGSVMFSYYNGNYNIVKKNINQNDISFKSLHNTPTTFNISDHAVVELFINVVLSCITINNSKLTPTIADNAQYLSSGAFGSTFIIDNYILKIVHMTQLSNATEIKNMLLTNRYPQYFCPLYCVITHNDSMMKHLTNDTYVNNEFQIYCPLASSIDSTSLTNKLSSVRSDVHNTQSNLCFLIMEKGNYDVLMFERSIFTMPISDILDYTNIHHIMVNNIRVDYKSNMYPSELVLMYASKMLNDLLRAVYVLNTDCHLLHCDIKPDNIMIMPNIANTLPQFKLIDFGSANPLPSNEELYSVVELGTLQFLDGLNLFSKNTYGETMYTTLYDYYRVFTSVTSFMHIVYLSSDPLIHYALKICDPYDATKNKLLSQLKKDELISMLLSHYSKIIGNITNPTIYYEISKLFNIIIILSQIPYLLRGDTSMIFYDKQHSSQLYAKDAILYRLDQLTILSSFRIFINKIIDGVL
jgi:serine/threonine protein kinase